MINNYERCKDCPYYYGEIDDCMFGEEGVPDNLEKKCEDEMVSNRRACDD